jgi:hypothetical protein
MIKSHLICPAIADIVEQLGRSNEFTRENYIERLEQNKLFIEQALEKFTKDKKTWFNPKRK